MLTTARRFLPTAATNLRTNPGKQLPEITSAYFIDQNLHQQKQKSQYILHQQKQKSKYILTKEELSKWDKDGVLLIRGALSSNLISSLSSMADQLVELQDGKGPWLTHRELVQGRKQITRKENFCYHLPQWHNLCFGVIQHLISQAYREDAILFKDKMNFKGPGGGGFSCHQDATAYATDDGLAQHHVSVLVAIDEATRENGCVEVSPGAHRMGFLPNFKGVTSPEVESELQFRNVLVQPGDVVLFDSYLPHRSGPNTTGSQKSKTDGGGLLI